MPRHSDLVALAFAAGLLASPLLAEGASLRAIGNSNAGAYRFGDADSGTPTPGPGSLSVLVASTASDGLLNPSPPPASWEMQALTGGAGVARYGSLAGKAHSEAKSVPANSFAVAAASTQLNLGYTDTAIVTSPSLAPGTPVTLHFLMYLNATAMHFIDGANVNPVNTGAAARHELTISDLDNIFQLPGAGALVINSRDSLETLRTFDFPTSVGHHLELKADLFVSAGVWVDYAAYNFTQGSADVLAEHTAISGYQPAGDVTLVSDSGRNYALPEPHGALAFGVAGLIAVARRRPRQANACPRPGGADEPFAGASRSRGLR